MVKRVFSMYYFKEDIFNISYFKKRSYVFGIQAIFQMLSHFRDHILLFFYIKIKYNVNNINNNK
jgi:hypothetical protein